jgi:hypothetical protein
MCKKSFLMCFVLVLFLASAALHVGAYEYVTPPAGDFTGDYLVDFEDINILADDWLASGYDLAGPLSTGLVSHYKFDGDANDSVGGNDGTEIGAPTYTAGLYEQAINLDGSDDYVDCGNDSSFDITGSITLSALIKGTFNSGWDPVIARGYDWMLSRGVSNEAVFYCIGVGFVLGSTNINDNQWHHVAGVYDGSKMLLYVDGEMDGSEVVSGGLNVSSSNVYIGGSPSASFNGLIDDVFIYSRALPEDQIGQLAGRRPTDLNTDGIVNLRDFARQVQQWLVDMSPSSPYAQWSNGPPTGASYFPIAVWLQRPDDAALWKNAGVNLYIGLWRGEGAVPIPEKLAVLRSAGMQVIDHQDSNTLDWKDITLSDGSPLIVGYLQADEPDNCQPEGEGWGPPVPTSTIQQLYSQILANDPTRPVFLNLGQGIGWDSGTWYGQGGYIDPDTDYPAYILGSDIVSFDIYPMNCSQPETCGDAWRVALGVDRLHGYSPDDHIVWNVIETGDISANGTMATIEEIRAEVWMSIVHGSTGITYFIHGKSSYGDFDDRALLRPEHADRLAAVTAINNRIHQLAPVLASQTLEGVATVEDVVGTTPVDFIVKQYGGATYLFAVGMRDAVTTKLFTLTGLADTTIDVIDEGRVLSLVDGQFVDTFDGYEAHLYKINTTQ